jgi:hypothetical protein
VELAARAHRVLRQPVPCHQRYRPIFEPTEHLKLIPLPGSFKNPPPGQPVTAPFDKERLQLGSKADDLHDEVARKNFRLVVIVPDVVEQTDLSDPEKGRRYRYTWDGETARHNAGWRTEELWP